MYNEVCLSCVHHGPVLALSFFSLLALPPHPFSPTCPSYPSSLHISSLTPPSPLYRWTVWLNKGPQDPWIYRIFLLASFPFLSSRIILFSSALLPTLPSVPTPPPLSLPPRSDPSPFYSSFQPSSPSSLFPPLSPFPSRLPSRPSFFFYLDSLSQTPFSL